MSILASNSFISSFPSVDRTLLVAQSLFVKLPQVTDLYPGLKFERHLTCMAPANEVCPSCIDRSTERSRDMSIVAGRIDYRLLHGIVQGFWCPTYATQRTMIIDDATANDPVRKTAMKMSKPSGQALSIITHEVAYNNFKNGKYDDHTVFVIARDPQTFLDLVEQGQKIPVLTLGLTELPPEGTPGYKAGRRAFIREEEVPIYKKIVEAGVKVEVRYMTTDKSVPISEYISI